MQKPRRDWHRPEHDPKDAPLSESNSTSSASPIPVGYCQCGCGQQTTIAKQTYKTKGHIKGQPHRYLAGHGKQKTGPKVPDEDRYIKEDCGYLTPCWTWQGPTSTGYARRRIKGQLVLVHRLMYEKTYGPIDPALEIDHLCRNRACINPDHLEAVTRAVNVRRGASTKLDVEAATEIRRLYSEEGWSQAKIARTFGVVQVTVSDIVRGRTWRTRNS